MPSPAISVCIPVRNGAQWIDEAIDSVLAQTRGDFELLVVENASTDGTADVARRRAAEDARVRVERFDVAVPAPANHNRAIRLSRGAFVKFLHADDVLYPHCLERMAAVLERRAEVGFVFARRDVKLEDPADPESLAWNREFATLHDRFMKLDAVNGGRDLLDQYLPALGDPQYRNWIAEPSAVMVRRACFDRVGTFTERMRQSWDLELWLRLFAHYDVGFVDEALGAFRHHPRSLTAANARRRADWLDLLWLYEGLLAEPVLEPYHALLRGFRRREARRAVRKQLGHLASGQRDLRPLAAYVGYRIRGG
jgi:glycosyltransferase involved in cell wall biosynthesis